MLIEEYDLEVFTPPCKPGAETWSAIAHLTTDISQVLPYLNATLPGASYNQAASALTWNKENHHTVFHPYKIATSNLTDRAEAEQVIKRLLNTINHTWEKRAETEPSFETRQRPAPMVILKLLPGTNCKECGQPTCFTFALKLVAGEQKPEECRPLLEPEFARQLAQLQVIFSNGLTIS